jgi:hypothetical protein
VGRKIIKKVLDKNVKSDNITYAYKETLIMKKDLCKYSRQKKNSGLPFREGDFPIFVCTGNGSPFNFGGGYGAKRAV